MKINKIYFAHYGYVVSMKKADAISLCEKAMKGEGYNLSEFPSSRELKKEVDRSKTEMRVGRRYLEVYHCLDWTTEEWSDLLTKLSQE